MLCCGFKITVMEVVQVQFLSLSCGYMSVEYVAVSVCIRDYMSVCIRDYMSVCICDYMSVGICGYMWL
jgi:hypothetical protein